MRTIEKRATVPLRRLASRPSEAVSIRTLVTSSLASMCPTICSDESLRSRNTGRLMPTTSSWQFTSRHPRSVASRVRFMVPTLNSLAGDQARGLVEDLRRIFAPCIQAKRRRNQLRYCIHASRDEPKTQAPQRGYSIAGQRESRLATSFQKSDKR